jgi:ribosomal protein S18 acetylase RimI-like enzyme
MSDPHEAAIRHFQETDLVSLGRLIQMTIDFCYSGVYPPRAVQFFKEFHSEEKIIDRHQKGEILVLEQDGNVIATGTIVGCDIFGVFVRPDFQHCGHGRALMCQLEDTAKERGCTELELDVSLPSKRFYESLGYEMLEECSIGVGEGQHLDFWRARKRLTQQVS